MDRSAPLGPLPSAAFLRRPICAHPFGKSVREVCDRTCSIRCAGGALQDLRRRRKAKSRASPAEARAIDAGSGTAAAPITSNAPRVSFAPKSENAPPELNCTARGPVLPNFRLIYTDGRPFPVDPQPSALVQTQADGEIG